MTTANKVTITRILLVPFFVVALIYYTRTGNEWHYVLSLVFFATAALSDGVDGYIARRYNQRSELGAILDPIADKLLLIVAIVLLSLDNAPYFERIPFWLTATIVSRDVVVVIGVVLVHYTVGAVHVRPHVIGKIATVLQMAVVLWTLLQWRRDVLPWLFYSAGVLTGLAGLLYVWEGMRQLSAHPTSSPTKS